MDSDLQKLEADLGALTPARLDEGLLDRLCEAAGDEPPAAGESLRALETSLRGLRPAPLSEDLMARLVSQVGQVPFCKDEKVLMFPGKPSPAAEAKGSRKGWLAAAAAVALAGAYSAFLYTPAGEGTAVAAGASATSTPAPRNVDAGAFAPASFGSGVSDTSDLGLVWSKDRRPMRVVRVVFTDRVNFKNNKGETVVMEVPRVEYLAVPEKID